ncbi:NAD(P)H-dependent glycerol-3-phosphate dehydrogenase [Mycoplasma sp. ATU-Cv-508]|uniref:NAD(P)H-dependent glycerol-3-phosphate dehydrogenase n=1 Tax=Mycoplasma sp. ATU-Cv-508 TaxID=2048001 RepID=UPI001374C327
MEIVERKLTFLAAISASPKLSQEVQTLLTNNYLKVFLAKDALGVQTGAIYKNVVAIASGLVTGLGYGLNAQAVVLTQGYQELNVLVKALGGQSKTAAGISGLGDLILTASSAQSRNFTYGLKLAKDASAVIDQTVEGLLALKVFFKIARQKKLKLPITEALWGIIHEKRDPQTILECLESKAMIS